MTCPPNRTNALGFSADSAASGKPASRAGFGRSAVVGIDSRQADADRVDVVGDIYRLAETTPTA